MPEVVKKNIVLFCFLGLLAGLSLGALVYQTIHGLGVTGLTDTVSWGLYVVNFTFCLSLGAGTIILLSIISRKEDVSYGFKFLLSAASLIFFCLAGISIMADLGRLDRFYYVFIHAQIRSPLLWDIISINTLVVVSAVFCLVMLRQIFLTHGLRSDASCVERFLYRILTAKKEITTGDFYEKKGSWILVGALVGVYFLTTELFAILRTKPQWNTPLLSLNFLVSAVLSGLAVVILLGGYYSYRASEKEKNVFLALGRRPLLVLLFVDLVVMLGKYAADSVNPLIQDVETLFPFSFFIFLVLGNIIPLYLILAHKKIEEVLPRYIPLLILTGILLKRAEVIIPAYFQRWLPFAPEASYIPSLTEACVLLGVYGIGIMAVMIVFYFILLLTEGKK